MNIAPTLLQSRSAYTISFNKFLHLLSLRNTKSYTIYQNRYIRGIRNTDRRSPYSFIKKINSFVKKIIIFNLNPYLESDTKNIPTWPTFSVVTFDSISSVKEHLQAGRFKKMISFLPHSPNLYSSREKDFSMIKNGLFYRTEDAYKKVPINLNFNDIQR